MRGHSQGDIATCSATDSEAAKGHLVNDSIPYRALCTDVATA